MIYMLTKFYEFISSETIFPILFGVPLFLSQIWYQKVQQKIIKKKNEKSFNQNVSIKELVTTTIWAALPLDGVCFEFSQIESKAVSPTNIQQAVEAMATCHGNTMSSSTVEGKAAMARPTRNGEARGEIHYFFVFYLISEG